MLKIKFNTNEFTIIFSEKIGKKKNAQKISFSLCSVQHPFFSSCFNVFSLFSASIFSAPLCFFFAPAFSFFFFLVFFSFQFMCALFFSPKTFFSAQNNSLFRPNVFASVQPLFSSSFFLLYSFLVQPSFFSFSASFFFFSLAPFIQGPIFSLAASHLFYLNKSLFSSNLE